MGRVTRFTGLSLALAVTSACGGGGGDGGIQAALQGTWMRCTGAATTSLSLSMTFDGAAYGEAVRTYSTPDCTGAPTSEFVDVGSFAVGAPLAKVLDGTPITAYEFTVTIPPFEPFYDLIHLDAAASPDRLYLGELSGGNDGSTPALRPTALDLVFLTRR